MEWIDRLENALKIKYPERAIAHHKTLKDYLLESWRYTFIDELKLKVWQLEAELNITSTNAISNKE